MCHAIPEASTTTEEHITGVRKFRKLALQEKNTSRVFGNSGRK
jgi:hypothetical protein